MRRYRSSPGQRLPSRPPFQTEANPISTVAPLPFSFRQCVYQILENPAAMLETIELIEARASRGEGSPPRGILVQISPRPLGHERRRHDVLEIVTAAQAQFADIQEFPAV